MIKLYDRIKRIKILGNYDYKNLIVFTVSIPLMILGLLSVARKTWLLFHDFDFVDIYVLTVSLPTTACFAVYYIRIRFLKKHTPKLVAFSFSIYSMFFFTISKLHYAMSYGLIFTSVLLLFSAHKDSRESILKSLFFFILALNIFFIKLFKLLPDFIEFSTETTGGMFYLAISMLIMGLGLFVYIFTNEVFERKNLENKLQLTIKALRKDKKKKGLTKKESEIIFLHMKGFSKEEICQILLLDIKTYRVHKSSILEKMSLYKNWNKDISRKDINYAIDNIVASSTEPQDE